MGDKTAFLIIDAQVNMFEEGASVFEGERVLQKLGQLLSRARAAHIPIVYVQHNGGEGDPDLPGTPGWQIHPALAPETGDVVVQKHTPDAFHETNLKGELEARGVRNLIIAGMQTDMCIDATCRRARALGYDVTLVADGHSTFDDGELTASQIIARYNEALGAVVKVEDASRVKF